MRAAYRSLELYDPRRAPCEVDLSDNTNLFGMPPAATRILGEVRPSLVTRYPSVYADRLKVVLAAHHGVEPENVVTGCGSDDVIDSAVRAFCEPGDALAYPSPTFGVVASFARMNAARPLPVEMADGLTTSAAALVAAGAQATYLCSPNNPTGAVAEPDLLEQLDRELPGVLLLDEAYGDFAERSHTRQAARSDRTLSLRTLSKAFGLAGLRVGYAVGPVNLVREVEKSRGPYKVSALAEEIACAVVADDAEWVRDRVAEAIGSRASLVGALQARGLVAPRSSGNFLLVRLPADRTAEAVAGRLRADGVGVRPFPALPGLGECIRVTVGPSWMMERFLSALDAALDSEVR